MKLGLCSRIVRVRIFVSVGEGEGGGEGQGGRGKGNGLLLLLLLISIAKKRLERVGDHSLNLSFCLVKLVNRH